MRPLATAIGQALVTGVALGVIFGLVALGFVVIYQVAGVLNFAQGSFVVWGGLFSSWLVSDLGWSSLVALVASVLTAMALGVAVGTVAVSVRQHGETAALIVTVGIGIVLEGVFLALFGDQPLSFSAPIGQQAWHLAKVVVLPQQVLMAGLGAVVVFAVQWLLRRTIWGMALRACAANPASARLFGMDPRRMATIAFAIAGGVGGLVGYLVTPMTGMDFGSDVTWTINGFSAAIVGGLGDPLWAVGGGLALGLVESFLGTFGSSAYETAGALVAMLVVLLWRPQGLFIRRSS